MSNPCSSTTEQTHASGATYDPHLILVEDDSIDVEAFKRALATRKVSWPVHVIADGWRALRALRNPTEEMGSDWIVVLDLNMPLMNGIEFLGEVRSDDKLRELDVFVLSTSEDPRDRVGAELHGVCGCWVKDGTLKTLLEFVDAIVAHCDRKRGG